ncbi:MAG: FecR domain-containing protein [Bacteroidetes bacterium]|uniref:FecR domain-containing protein n=1 Tax=Candidatus Cryptobacteroides intestinavium TaxID=2840766 RepID=A0A9D9HIY3_9BACT|nr:FecR domain-containing protein [Candidatus Cryptobacteroides intestinavium]
MTDEAFVRDLVIKYINRSCTKEELSCFLDMMKQNPESFPELDASVREQWEKEPLETIDDDAYAIYRQEALRLIRKSRKGRKFSKRQVPFGRAAAVAASLAVLISGGYFIISDMIGNRVEKQLATYEHIVAAPGQIREITLPDGTEVTLNVASSLKYNARYGKESREVWLDGEAFFDVESNEECPFSIHSGMLDVNVTGTSFNVCAYNDNPMTTVTVKSGKVGVVYGDDDIRMNLRADEEIVINTDDSSVSRNAVNAMDALKWMRGSLIFRQNTLPEVIRILRRHYSCDIELRDSTSSVRISGTHDNKSIESVLESICFSAGLHYRVKDGGYVIY